MIFFLSDTHAFHDKMLEIRGFQDLKQMNCLMADAINSVVTNKDTLIHAGDWSFGSIENAISFRSMINCKDIHLVIGNHDQRFVKNKKFKDLFTKVHDIHIIRKNEINVCVCHYPIESWPSMRYGTIHVHGHCHSPIREMKNRYNVCVDVGGFRPISLEDLSKKTKEENEFAKSIDPDF